MYHILIFHRNFSLLSILRFRNFSFRSEFCSFHCFNNGFPTRVCLNRNYYNFFGWIRFIPTCGIESQKIWWNFNLAFYFAQKSFFRTSVSPLIPEKLKNSIIYQLTQSFLTKTVKAQISIFVFNKSRSKQISHNPKF